MLPLESYRRWATELVEYACGYAAGRVENDAVYQAVTEGRDRGPAKAKYSSCGDLAHWLLFRLGVRSAWVNRSENKGWLSSDLYNNVTLLQRSPALVKKPGTGMRYKPGDIGIIWGTGWDAHVFVILDDQQPRALYVGEYGQPGGHLKARVVGYQGGRLCIGVKALNAVLPLEAVIYAAAAAHELGAPENVRTWAARLHLPPPDPRASDTEPPDTSIISTEPPPPPSIAPGLPTLRLGDEGMDVEQMQALLNKHGAAPALRVDGDFGARTDAALRAFQRARMLKPDGVCGRFTWGELFR